MAHQVGRAIQTGLGINPINQNFDYTANTSAIDEASANATNQANTFMDPTSQWYQNMRRTMYEGVGNQAGVQNMQTNRNMAARGIGSGGINNMLSQANMNQVGEQVRQGNAGMLNQGMGYGQNMLNMAMQGNIQSGQMQDQATQYGLTSDYNQQSDNRAAQGAFVNNMMKFIPGVG